MTEKMEFVIRSTQNNIKFQQEEIDEYVSQIRERAASYKDYDLVAFLPGLLNRLKDAMEKKKVYEDQLKMLEYLQK